jgi:hypothetical protein
MRMRWQMGVEAQAARHARDAARLRSHVDSMRARAEQLEALATQSQTHIGEQRRRAISHALDEARVSETFNTTRADCGL